MNKRGSILTENFIFLVLNLVFISILLVFAVTASTSKSEFEERYAKEVALMLDGVKPNSVIYIKADKLVEKAGDSYSGNIFSVEGNVVTVKLGEGGGYSYSFFNDNINVVNIFRDDSHNGDFAFVIEPKFSGGVIGNE